jgi:hypothetical protein
LVVAWTAVAFTVVAVLEGVAPVVLLVITRRLTAVQRERF